MCYRLINKFVNHFCNVRDGMKQAKAFVTQVIGYLAQFFQEYGFFSYIRDNGWVSLLTWHGIHFLDPLNYNTIQSLYEKSKIPFSYMLCLFCKRAYRGTKPGRELWMKIQESFLPSFPFFHLLLHCVRQPFLGIPPFISDPGSLCLLLDL